MLKMLSKILIFSLFAKCSLPYNNAPYIKLGDIPGLVMMDDNQYILVSLVGDCIDLVCNANGAVYPLKTFQWKKNGKVVKYGNLMIEERYPINNVDEDMDGMTVSCTYAVIAKHPDLGPSWNMWTETVEFAVFKPIIRASKETCETGEGDLQLSFQKVTRNRESEAHIEKKIKSGIEDRAGLSINDAYSVTLTLEKAQKYFAMNPDFIIDGNPTSSCPKFKEAPNIDKRCLRENNEIRISKLEPSEASSDEPVKIIIFAENLPPPGDISVIFSTPEWTKEEKPVYQHHNHALEVFTPKLDQKILDRTKVSIQLVLKNNKTKSNSAELIFLPAANKDIYQDTPKSKDPETDESCQTEAVQIGLYVITATAGVLIGVILSFIAQFLNRKRCVRNRKMTINDVELENQWDVSSDYSQSTEEAPTNWEDGPSVVKKMMGETGTSLIQRPSIKMLEQQLKPRLGSESNVLTTVVGVPLKPKQKTHTKNGKMSSDESYTKTKEMKISALETNKVSSKSKDIMISSIAPNEALSTERVKIIILAENLPEPGDISVMFSTPEWAKEEKPVSQHHNNALEVFTPKLDQKILHKTKVSIQLVRNSNQTKTKPFEFSFLPPMETYQAFPPTQDLIEEGSENYISSEALEREWSISAIVKDTNQF